VLFLVASERRESEALEARVVLDGRTFRRAPAQARSLLTWFGVACGSTTSMSAPRQAAERARAGAARSGRA